VLLLTFACHPKKQEQQPAVEGVVYPDKEWAYNTEEYSKSVGASLDSLSHIFKKKYSLLILKKGKILFEKYETPYSRDTLIHVNSCTKSVVSMLFGMVFQSNLKDHINTPAVSYFPEYDLKDTPLQKIENRHFLSMSSGLEWKGGIDATDVIAMSESEDWAKYVFERKVIHEPGETYLYNSGGTQVISHILHRETGNDLEQFAVDSLFSPLGIENYYWDKTLNGVPKAGWGLHLKMKDMAKLGYLMLRNGRWKEKQIIPKEWVHKATSSHSNISDTWKYGYQFWIPNDVEDDSYFFRGYYPPAHKIIEVIPSLDVVAVYVGGNSDFKEVIRAHLNLLEKE